MPKKASLVSKTPTGEMRFKGETLQREFRVSTRKYDEQNECHETAETVTSEWKDVPSVAKNAKDVESAE